MLLAEKSLWNLIEEGNLEKKIIRNSEHKLADNIQFTGDGL